MKRIALIAVLSLSATLAACASPSEETVASVDTPVRMEIANVQNAPLPMAIAPAAPSSPEDALVIPVTYVCSDGRSFIAAFPADGETVRIAAAGETRVLSHREGLDAVMFTDGDVTLTAEGADATLTGIDAAYTGCMAG